MGFITPELLAKLFADPESASEKLRPPTAKATKDDDNNKLNVESDGMEIEVNSAVADGEVDSD